KERTYIYRKNMIISFMVQHDQHCATDQSKTWFVNRYFKYADDAYLVVPGSNVSSIQNELDYHSQWASQCNLKLTPTKTSEIVFSRKGSKQPPVNPGITRLESINILGVVVDNVLQSCDYNYSIV